MSQCNLCGKLTESLFALLTPANWSKSICRSCISSVTVRRCWLIAAELDRQRFKVDETWSLYGFDPDDYAEERYKAAAKVVDDQMAAEFSGVN